MTPLTAFRIAWTRTAPGTYRHASGVTIHRSGRDDRFRWMIAGGPRDSCLFGSLTSAAAVATPEPAPWPRDVRRERILHAPAPPAGMLF